MVAILLPIVAVSAVVETVAVSALVAVVAVSAVVETAEYMQINHTLGRERQI